jgi:hypothetical protein
LRSYPVTNQEAANQALADNIKNSEEQVGPTSIKPTGPSNPNRPPCMWILAQPMTPDATAVDESRPEVALPVSSTGCLDSYVTSVAPACSLSAHASVLSHVMCTSLICYALLNAPLQIHIDNAMPDYVVRHEQFERGMAKKWASGDRIRMFFGGKVR